MRQGALEQTPTWYGAQGLGQRWRESELNVLHEDLLEGLKERSVKRSCEGLIQNIYTYLTSFFGFLLCICVRSRIEEKIKHKDIYNDLSSYIHIYGIRQNKISIQIIANQISKHAERTEKEKYI